MARGIRYLQVLVQVPEDVPLWRAREYIRDELAAAGGCKPVDDPLFHGLEVVSIKSAMGPRK